MRISASARWLLSCLLAFSVAGAASAQSPAHDGARPRDPENPYLPPPCTGAVFNDITCSTGFDAWIEQYALDDITGGCGGGNYCPGSPVTRAQMAVFVEKAMRGTDTWSPGDLGRNNTAVGGQALPNAQTGWNSTALGFQALWSQSFQNAGVAWYAYNTALGAGALRLNQPTNAGNGIQNTAVGAVALSFNVTGQSNTAVGFNGLNANSASFNTAVGALGLAFDADGFDNTAIGNKAGARGGDVVVAYSGSGNATFVDTVSGSYNTFVGINGATADVDNCTALGMDAYCDASNQVRLGNAFVNSIGGKVAWSSLSDRRAKTNVQDLDLGLPFVLALHPVSYRYKSGNGRIDMGFVGQDVEALIGDRYNLLDVGGDADRTLSLRYSELIAPLVKATQEQEREIRARDRRIADLEEQVQAQRTRLDALEQEIETFLGHAPTATPPRR